MNLAKAGSFTVPVFSNSEMMSFTRAKTATFRKWMREKSIEAGTRNSNSHIIYSVSDLLKIRLVTKLAIASNVPVLKAAEAADMADSWFAENYCKDTNSKACLVVYSDAEPQIANDSADLESILNERSGAVVVRLSSFLKSAISPSMSMSTAA